MIDEKIRICWGDKVREIHFLTWNTQLYEMGNRLNEKQAVKEIDNQKFKIVINKVKEFLDSKNEAVAVLQEITFRCNIYGFNKHRLFGEFLEFFPDDKYVMKYNISSEKQIKMTVVLAKKTGLEELVYKKNNLLNNNMCVSFGIKDLDLSIIGVHPHNANELLKWLQEWGFPDIMLGDFNAGDYKKRCEDNVFRDNRDNYKNLISGYTDICNGEMTRRTVFPNGFVYETPIDHVLIKNSSELTKKYQCEIVKIDRNMDNVSDHYPIYFKLLCLDEADKSR